MMRKTFAGMLCLLFIGLCGCWEIAEEEQGTTTSAAATEAVTAPLSTASQLAAMSKEEALSLVNRRCGDAYDMTRIDFDEPEFGLQIRSKSNDNFKLLCEGPKTDSGGSIYFTVQQFEFVLDDPETGEGHTATANWFSVYANGEITSMFEYDENGELELNQDY